MRKKPVQLLLPALTQKNPELNKAKLDPVFKTKKGKDRTPRGIERRLKAQRLITAEEEEKHLEYEESGKDETDGETYWSAFRGR